jgi:hypothetical protein
MFRRSGFPRQDSALGPGSVSPAAEQTGFVSRNALIVVAVMAALGAKGAVPGMTGQAGCRLSSSRPRVNRRSERSRLALMAVSWQARPNPAWR